MEKTEIKKTDRAFYKMAKAVAEYIKEMGGSAIVVGDVSVGKREGSRKFNHFIQINFTGKAPTKKNT